MQTTTKKTVPTPRGGAGNKIMEHMLIINLLAVFRVKTTDFF
jgi:hypothetical protein